MNQQIQENVRELLRTWSYMNFQNINVAATLLMPSKSHAKFSWGQPFLELYREGPWKYTSSLGSLAQYKGTFLKFYLTSK